jgi:hypothetical protein
LSTLPGRTATSSWLPASVSALVIDASARRHRLPFRPREQSVRVKEIEETHTMASSNPCIEKQFYNARTHSAWIDKPVTEETLRELYDASK